MARLAKFFNYPAGSVLQRVIVARVDGVDYGEDTLASIVADVGAYSAQLQAAGITAYGFRAEIIPMADDTNAALLVYKTAPDGEGDQLIYSAVGGKEDSEEDYDRDFWLDVTVDREAGTFTVNDQEDVNNTGEVLERVGFCLKEETPEQDRRLREKVQQRILLQEAARELGLGKIEFSQ